MPMSDSGASALASLLDGSSAGELTPELARQRLQQLIELEVAAVLAADRHERTEERCGYRNGSRPRLLTTQVGDIPPSVSQGWNAQTGTSPAPSQLHSIHNA